MKLINNISETLKDDLQQVIVKGSKLSIASASFSIYAFEALKKELEGIEELRFIFTSPTFHRERVKKEKREFFIPKLGRERTLYGSDFEIKLRNQLSQKAIAKECANWIRNKVKFKTNITDGVINGYIDVCSGENQHVYTPINEFTTTELGCEKGNNMCTQITRLPAPFASQFLSNFNDLWNNGENFKDITDIVIENIENVYKENSPDFIYFVTLYNIFNEFLEDISEDVLPNEASGFKDSQIWNKLYNFQKDACLAIINKLEKYNGCILADSVGLGKTFTALSVIKYYENRNKSVLVLCPKKLVENWNTYRHNYKTNPIVLDRLRYDVLFHSDLSRKGGTSNGIDLTNINWGNYDLVVIDESHNFRNGGKVSTDENDENPRENRYLQLMNKVIKAGVKTKVLMLSATPVNNRFNDLKHQLALAYEGNSEQLDELLDTTNTIDDIFRIAQTSYNEWSKLPAEERTTEALLNSLSFDFFELLDAVTIARSRKHIEKYYDTTDIGSFPERLKPISRRPDLTDLSAAITFNDIFRALNDLILAIYVPSAYILPSKMSKYEKDDEGTHGLTLANRERGIRKLMSIQLLKRLESSVNSFALSLKRMETVMEKTIELIDSKSVSSIDDYDVDGFDFDSEDAEIIIGNKKNKIALEDIDIISWRRDLQTDIDNLELMLYMLRDITPEHDMKLMQLKEDIDEKIKNPINGDNKKVLIFTAFSDTAKYLYDNLADYIKEKYGLNTAIVSGDGEACKTIKIREKLDFNTILTLFSPASKEKEVVFPNIHEEIDVLIATDCISEGQNLQDCDYLINYDIHWNPVRIIQRFGRIDRIGSKNSHIQLVNYWPNMTLDEYINLKGRVESRMKATILTSTGDDNLLSPEEKGDLEYRREQLKRLHEEVVDLEEMNQGISIMDLGLNEFRLDLLAYMKSNPDIEHTPFGLHAVAEHNEECPPGVVFVLKNRSGGVNIDHKNRLHPFYMVYLTMDGQTHVNHLSPKELLDKMRHICKDKSEPLKALCKEFNKETGDGRKMERYSALLGDAISSIVDVKESSSIDSFLEGVQGELFEKQVSGLDDFELICFLVVK